MSIQQVSVFVENKPGRLAEVASVLSRSLINIQAISVADTADFGILRMIVDDPAKASEILKAEGFMVNLTEVLALQLDDKPGSLAVALSSLASAQIAVEYLFAFVTRTRQKACIIIRVEDPAKAASTLSKDGFTLLDFEGVLKL